MKRAIVNASVNKMTASENRISGDVRLHFMTACVNVWAVSRKNHFCSTVYKKKVIELDKILNLLVDEIFI